MATDTTTRTKRAVRAWAGLKDTDPLVLDAVLDKLRPGALNSLLTNVNAQFKDVHGFPCPPADWNALTLTTVRTVRNACRKRRDA